jgi:hypothetical protein
VIYIAIISNPAKPSSWLTQFFTGSPAYHIAFVDTDGGKMYDMNLLFRRRPWPYYDSQHVALYQCPVTVTREDLEWELDHSEDWYGVLDYLSFGLKKLGFKNQPSHKGSICSEKVEEILMRKGWKSPFTGVPSPADFENVLIPV